MAVHDTGREAPLNRNAAHLLADLLEALTVPQNTHPQTTHGFRNAEDVRGWRTYIERLSLVRAVDDQIHAMARSQDVSIFERSLGHWYAGVGMAVTPWDSSQSRARATCGSEHLNMLRALAMLIDASPHLVLYEDDRRALQDVLAEAQQLIETDTTMASDVRAYIDGLLQRIVFLLENLEKYGAEPIRAVALELGGVMYTQAQREPDPEKQNRWSAAAWGFVTGFLTRSGTGSADMMLNAAEQGFKALGS